MQEGRVRPDLGRLADHRPHAVVDEEARTDERSWMDIDAGREAGDRLHESGQDREPGGAEEVGDPVREQGPEARVAQRLEDGDRAAVEGGIPFEHGSEVGADIAEPGEGGRRACPRPLGIGRPGRRIRGHAAARRVSIDAHESIPPSIPIKSRMKRSTRRFFPSAGKSWMWRAGL